MYSILPAVSPRTLLSSLFEGATAQLPSLHLVKPLIFKEFPSVELFLDGERQTVLELLIQSDAQSRSWVYLWVPLEQAHALLEGKVDMSTLLGSATSCWVKSLLISEETNEVVQQSAYQCPVELFAKHYAIASGQKFDNPREVHRALTALLAYLSGNLAPSH